MGLLGLLSLLHSAFFGDQALQELKMMSSVAPYEQLVRQVEALKAENSHLRRELRDNSSHLSKLETETSGMKEVLKRLQSKLEQEARVLVSSGQTEVLEQLKALQMDIASLYNLKFQPPALEPEPTARTPEESPLHSSGPSKDSFGELSRATIRLLEELDRERCFLLNEIEKEEKEKLWYYSQLQGLSKRLDELPHVETFSMQMDLIRQQLEFEAQHIRSLMEERFGTSDEMVQRAQIRASRLEQIDKELLSAQDRVQHTEPQALLAVKSVPVEDDPETEVPTHPEDGAPQPGNSKVEVVFWLLSMLATRDQEDTARTLLAMSSSPESCVAMRRSGCLPLLLQILHGAEAGAGGRSGTPGAPGAKDARMRANAALHNIVFSQPDQGLARKEMRVLHVLEQIRAYCETCWDWLQAQDGGPEGRGAPVPIEPQICQATCAVMKLSFDEEYRRAMNELGGLQAVAELLQVDYEMHKMTRDPLNLALRRYAGMTLTNLTFGDVANKATLCAHRGCMEAIVAQLASESEELHQVVSSILRNLSWRADIHSKKVLREVGSMAALVQCVLRASKESTLKSVLSALWNLSAHSTENKAAICQVDGALGFLVSTLTYKCQSNSLAIIESGGGILRNVSSLIATREDYRQVLRDHNCLQTLLQHLTSHSLTIVSNACGTLWNLSARSARDQELLWDLGAVGMLRNLVHSRHKMIAMGSAAALRNLLAHRPAKYQVAATAVSPGACAPSLYVRKQRALEAELDTRHLAQALDRLGKQGPPEAEAEAEAASKRPLPPLRLLDGLAQDYASDSGCFDDDDAPSLAAAASAAEPASPAMLSLFLGSSFLQGQALARTPPTRLSGPEAEKESGGEVAVAARAKAKLALAVARIDRLVEDISALHTSSDDSFSLSSGDPGQEGPRESRAQSCSPCRGPEGGRREAGGRAHPLLRLKAAHASLSNDSLNSGSASDGRCSQDPTRPRPLAVLAEHREGPLGGQARPHRLDLNLPSVQADPAARDAVADAHVRTIKLSPSYQHVPLLEGNARAGTGPLGPGTRKQAWLPAEGLSKVPEKLVAEAPPLCLSHCSSVSSLSSAGHPGPSEAGDLDDSDTSLEGLEEAGPSEAELDGAWHRPGAASLPVAIPAPRRGRGLGVEDATPSSSSENCVQETPLVLSRCSSVSSLGSFESPSIASSIPSDPCSGPGSGTVSPSELPDSPGQTVPPSRSKTPPLAPVPPCERDTTQFSLQWESYVKRFLDIADCRERCRLPSELDAGSVRFTVEKPDENFSCASSLSALALHEHYVQKDVELRLLPPTCLERSQGPSQHLAGHRRRDEAGGRLEGPPAANQELELLHECLGMAMPARLRKVASALAPGRGTLPVYMLVPAAREGDPSAGSAEGTPVDFSSTTSLSDETLQGCPQDPPRACADRHKPADHAAPTRQATGHGQRAGGTGRGTGQARGAGRGRAALELPLRQSPGACVDRDSGRTGRARGDGELQSLCLTTPTEEAVYCFYDNDSEEEPSEVVAAPPRRASGIPRAVKRERPVAASRKEVRAAPKAAPPARAQPSLIADEMPPCFSLSSSASSLSEPEPSQSAAGRPRAREPVVPRDRRSGHDGSPGPRAKAELPRPRITSAVPRRWPQVSVPRHRRPPSAQPDKRPAEGPREHSDEAAGSDRASDLDSVEWRAIQEGADSIVAWLRQAAAATRKTSSESDSIPSTSGLSAGSPQQPAPLRKGRRPKAEGQAGSAVRPERWGPALAQRRGGGGGRPRSPSGSEKPRSAKTTPGMPAVLRGRTVIYMPSPATRAQPRGTPSPRAAPRKMGPLSPTRPAAPSKVPGPGQQRSRSLHRLGRTSELTAPSAPQRSATPPARLAKTPSSGSSQTSPASQSLPGRSPPASQASGPLPGPGASPVPRTPARALLAKQHKTQKSPVRIPFMQRPAQRGPPALARAAPEPGPRGRAGAEGCPGARGGRLGLVRVASARSSGSESSDRSGFRRQLTFIKESPGLLRRRSELSAAEATTSASRGGSPHRGRPTLPAVFLCSSRCDELRAGPQKAPAPQRPPVSRPSPGEWLPRRTSSESLSRLPVRTPAGQPEKVKRYASLPHISVSHGPDGATPRPTADSTRRGSDGEARPLPRVAALGTTWRRIRDEDVPHILRSTLPPTALPLRGASPEEATGNSPQRKTSDAVVQTEDFTETKTHPSTSPSPESREPPQAPASGRTPLLGSHVDGPGPTKAPMSTTPAHESPGVAAGGFPTSRHGSPSRSARVPPFNYVPSPMVVATTALAVEKAIAPTPASLLE